MFWKRPIDFFMILNQNFKIALNANWSVFTWRHKKWNSESSWKHSVSQCVEGWAVERQGSAHQHVKHHSKALNSVRLGSLSSGGRKLLTQTSISGPLYCCPSNTSGAAYGGEPHQVFRLEDGLQKLEKPKSAIFIFMLESKRRFSAFKSRWTTLLKISRLVYFFSCHLKSRRQDFLIRCKTLADWWILARNYVTPTSCEYSYY